MQNCEAKTWLLEGSERECPTCGRGPCPTSFRIPVRVEHPDTEAALASTAERTAKTRGLKDVEVVFDGVVREYGRQVLYSGTRA